MKKYDINNVFAKIIRGEIPAKKVYEDEMIVAFNDIAKVAPVHILVVPKGQYISFDDFINKAKPKEVSNFFKKIQEIAKSQNLDKTGYRIISNNGASVGQSVFHFHVHLIGGKKLGNLLP